jgi:hypothetical protein
MEAVKTRGQGQTVSRSRIEADGTPRERFETRPEEIALSAVGSRQSLLRGGSVESETYDSTPFGLRRRLRPRLPPVAQKDRHDPAAAAAITKREGSARRDGIPGMRRACLDAARDLLLEMILVEAELARSACPKESCESEGQRRSASRPV